jgi:hypothetical protein
VTAQRPSPAFAAEEQYRVDGLAARIVEIQATPAHLSAGSVGHYQAAYQDASGNAARHGEQPGGGR